MMILTADVAAGALAVSGRIDASNANELDKALRTLEEHHRGQDLVVDLGEATYISSSGLRILLLAHRRRALQGSRLLLANTPSRIMHVLNLAGFHRVFSFHQGSIGGDAAFHASPS